MKTLLGLVVMAIGVSLHGESVSNSAAYTSPDGLVAWWKGENNAIDSVSGNNGVAVGALGYAAGKVGQAFVLDGSTSYIPLPASASLNIGTGSGISIEGWVQPTASTLNGWGVPIIEWDSATTDGLSLWFGSGYGPGYLLGNVKDTSGVSHTLQSVAGLFFTNKLQHVALTYDKNTGNARLYLDGAVIASTNFGSITPQTTYPVNIGRRTGQPIGLGQNYGGLIDELSLYNRGLTSNEIAALHTAGSAGKTLPSQPPAYITPDGIVAWWKGEENTTDSVGANHATAIGAVTFVDAKVGKGFRFDGAGSYLSVPHAPSLNLSNALSVEFWFKNEGPLTGVGLMAKRGTTLIPCNFGINIISTGVGAYHNDPFVSNAGDDIGAYEACRAPQIPSTNEFHHLAATWNQVSSNEVQMQLFMDGQLLRSRTVAGSLARTLNGEIVTIAASAATAEYFKGIMDEVSLYSRALGTNEIASIYAAGSAGKSLPPAPAALPSGIVSWWRAETNGLDSVGSNHGTITGGASYAPGRVGQAFTFNGSGQKVVVSNSPSLNPTNAITIEAWVCMTAPFSGVGGTIVGKDGVYSERQYFLGMVDRHQQGLTNVPNSWVFRSYLGVGGGEIVDGTSIIAFGDWHHVAMAYDGSKLQLFVDGKLESSSPVSGPILPTTQPLLIGGSVPGPWDFSGKVDELSIYNRALGTNEIASIYAAGSAGKILPPAPAALPTGIVSWWRAENNAFDSISANHGSVTGGVMFASGRVAQSFVFDGNGDGIGLGNPTNLQLQNLTIEAWVKRNSLSTSSLGSGGNGAIFGGGWGSYLFYITSDGQLIFNKLGDLPTYGPKVNDTNFHHVAVTKGGSTTTFYMDGVAYPAADITSVFTFTTSFGIGIRPDNLDNSFLGAIDELSVYNRALGSNEIAAIYGAGSAGKSLPAETAPEITQHPVSKEASSGDVVSFVVGAKGTVPLCYQWMLDGTPVMGATNSAFVLNNIQPSNAGGYAAVVTNSLGSVTSHIATLNVTVPECTPAPAGMFAWWQAESNAMDSMGSLQGSPVGQATYGLGKVGQAFVFDGNGDGFNLGNPTSLRLQNFTIETWIKRASASVVTLAPAQTTAALFAYGSGGYGLGLYNDGSLFLSRIGLTATIVPNLVTDTNWHHVAVTKNGTNVVFHVDGVAYVAPAPYTSTFTFSSNVAIGARGDNIGNSFLGRIDELAVYSTPLSSAAVSAIYAARSQGKCQSSLYPAIVMQPISKSAVLGDTVPFSVTASGAQPLSYQWYFGPTPKSGGTNSSIVLPNVQPSDAGSYSVIVSNKAGAITSVVAQLSVVVPECSGAANGLVSWWPAEGNALDSLGANHGVPFGQSSYGPGKALQAFVFDGNGDGIGLGNPTNLQLQNLTIEAWVKRNSLSTTSLGSGGNGVIFGGGWDSYLFYFASDGRLVFNKLGDFPTFGPLVSDTNFHHVAVTKGGSTTTFYLDGVAYPAADITSVFTFTTSFGIGIRPDNLDNSFLGAIDELSVYNRALGSNEIAAIYGARGAGKCPLEPTITQHPVGKSVFVGDDVPFSVTATGFGPLEYQWLVGDSALPGATNATLSIANVQLNDAGNYSVKVFNAVGSVTSSIATLTVVAPECSTPPEGIVAWWKAESNGLDSVTSNHGTLTGDASYASGKAGLAFVFNGSGQTVVVSNSPSLNPTNAITVEGWVCMTAPFSGVGGTIVGKDGVYSDRQYFLGMVDRNQQGLTNVPNSWVFRSYLGVGGGEIVDGTSVVALGDWHHVAMSYDGSMLRLFVDGKLESSAPVSGSITPTTQPLLIGGSVPGPWDFTGKIDELSVYNRALGSNEIAAIYAARGAGKCPLPPTILAVTPPSVLVNEGANVAFTASAAGSPPLTYQWHLNGGNLAGATNSSLSLNGVLFEQAGTYTVVVSGPGGMASSNVVLAINRAPLADAGATEKLLISPNGSNAVAILDGSLSSDPDGDVLTYAWFHVGDSNAFATGVVAITSLPLGTNALTLVVNDGMAVDDQHFAVEVITTSQAVDRLVQLVEEGVERPQPLISSLRAALASIDRSQPAVAINQLEAFKNKVLAQVFPVDPELAEQLLADAQAIIDVLNGEPVEEVALAITSITQGKNGKPKLSIRGNNKRTHIVEMSTNLVDWVPIGVAQQCGDCAFDFEDGQGQIPVARYYRVVSPK